MDNQAKTIREVIEAVYAQGARDYTHPRMEVDQALEVIEKLLMEASPARDTISIDFGQVMAYREAIDNYKYKLKQTLGKDQPSG